MRILGGIVGYFAFLLIEHIDPCTAMLRTDDYRGRYRRRWFEFQKFTRAS